MQNPFKNIIEHQEVPEMLKERIMDDVRVIKLTLDLADLVSVKYPSSIFNILDTTKNNKKKNNKK